MGGCCRIGGCWGPFGNRSLVITLAMVASTINRRPGYYSISVLGSRGVWCLKKVFWPKHQFVWLMCGNNSHRVQCSQSVPTVNLRLYHFIMQKVEGHGKKASSPVHDTHSETVCPLSISGRWPHSLLHCTQEKSCRHRMWRGFFSNVWS